MSLNHNWCTTTGGWVGGMFRGGGGGEFPRAALDRFFPRETHDVSIVPKGTHNTYDTPGTWYLASSSKLPFYSTAITSPLRTFVTLSH